MSGGSRDRSGGSGTPDPPGAPGAADFPAACLPARAISPLRVAGAAGILLMLGVIGHALVAGDFFAEGAWLLAHPWGRVSLVDLYVGFALVCVVIAARERSARRAIPWIAAVLVLGNLATCVYVVFVLLGRRSLSEARMPDPSQPGGPRPK